MAPSLRNRSCFSSRPGFPGAGFFLRRAGRAFLPPPPGPVPRRLRDEPCTSPVARLTKFVSFYPVFSSKGGFRPILGRTPFKQRGFRRQAVSWPKASSLLSGKKERGVPRRLAPDGGRGHTRTAKPLIQFRGRLARLQGPGRARGPDPFPFFGGWLA